MEVNADILKQREEFQKLIKKDSLTKKEHTKIINILTDNSLTKKEVQKMSKAFKAINN